MKRLSIIVLVCFAAVMIGCNDDEGYSYSPIQETVKVTDLTHKGSIFRDTLFLSGYSSLELHTQVNDMCDGCRLLLEVEGLDDRSVHVWDQGLLLGISAPSDTVVFLWRKNPGFQGEFIVAYKGIKD